jgi:hypothetical protein
MATEWPKGPATRADPATKMAPMKSTPAFAVAARSDVPTSTLVLIALALSAVGLTFVHMALARLRNPTAWRETGWWGRHETIALVLDLTWRRHRTRPGWERWIGLVQLLIGAAFLATAVFILVTLIAAPGVGGP